MNRFLGALAIGALSLSACDTAAPDLGNAPVAASAAVTASASASSDAIQIPGDLSIEVKDRHLVLFNGNGVPASFDRTVRRLGGTVVLAHEAGVGVVEGLDEAGAARLARSGGIADVQPDYYFVEDRPDATAPEAAAPDSPLAPETAFFFPRQWNMRAIDADDAWDAGRLGSSDVTVAILDTGIDYLHPDLVGRVDLENSVSFLPLENSFATALGREPFTDVGYHGTHVAATVASNAFAAAGVTSQTTLMAVKVCYGNDYVDGSGNLIRGCPGSAIVAGILHAIDNGADVINMSLGGYFSKAGNGEFVGFYNKLFNAANRAGVTVVVSAGNESIDLDHDGNGYKTYCSAPNVLCISATGPTARESVNGPFTDIDAPAYFTNYGRSAINVAAPGGNTGNFVYAACSSSSLAIPVCRTGTFVVGLGGTSMAAPHVSGLAALLVEDFGRRPGQIRAQIQNSADDLGARGTDPYYGKGRINVARALGVAPDA